MGNIQNNIIKDISMESGKKCLWDTSGLSDFAPCWDCWSRDETVSLSEDSQAAKAALTMRGCSGACWHTVQWAHVHQLACLPHSGCTVSWNRAGGERVLLGEAGRKKQSREECVCACGWGKRPWENQTSGGKIKAALCKTQAKSKQWNPQLHFTNLKNTGFQKSDLQSSNH